MVRNILVEGIDCAGKSTLVKELKNALSWDVKQLHHQDVNQFQRYFREYTFSDKIIFERGHLSEIIYSRIFKRAEPFTPDEQNLINEYCKLKMIIILASPDTETAIKRYRARSEVLQTIQLQQLVRGHKYFGELTRTFPKIIVYRSRNFSELHRVVSKIIKMVKDDIDRLRNY